MHEHWSAIKLKVKEWTHADSCIKALRVLNGRREQARKIGTELLHFTYEITKYRADLRNTVLEKIQPSVQPRQNLR